MLAATTIVIITEVTAIVAAVLVEVLLVVAVSFVAVFVDYCRRMFENEVWEKIKNILSPQKTVYSFVWF